MSRPSLTIEDIQRIFPDVGDLQFVDECGQKQVFSGSVNGKKYAYKLMRIEGLDDGLIDDTTTARAKREVETMMQCDCPYLVKTGTLGLRVYETSNQKLSTMMKNLLMVKI
ncbi:hypothetical protein FACS189454_08270 [Planctomycetales bacterium]|nr:hypothetical protein FACS189454_08270 [Planctomycetales bacterium]